MSLARRVLYVPVAAVRPYLLFKCTLLIVAFDLWLTRIEHSGRYGAGGFNVAHFAWLDAIQPSVTPGLHIAVTTLAGLLCFALVIAPRPPRWLLALTFLLYTWSWAMSMLDSYQHHYLLSIVLAAFVFFPRLRAEDALVAPAPPPPVPASESRSKKKQKKKPVPDAPAASAEVLAPAPTTVAWAYVVLAASIAIVYAYAAYGKTADEWISGASLMRVVGIPPSGALPPGAEDPFALFRAIAAPFGFDGDRFYWLMGHSVVVIQIVCAAGYLLAPFLDMTRSLTVRVFAWIALGTALSFHVGAEVMKLEIGWFSWYMMLFALLYLLPSRVLVVVARAAVLWSVDTATDRRLLFMAARMVGGLVVALLAGRDSEWAIVGIGVALIAVSPVRLFATMKVPPPVVYLSVAAGTIALVFAGAFVDLPGAHAAGVIAACMLGAGTVGLLVGRGEARAIHPYGVAALLGALSFVVAISLSTVRYDFYRNVGGDERRRGDLVAAYEAYVKANRYAPEGEDRRRQERELHDELVRRGQLRR